MATSSTTTNLGLPRPDYSDFADVKDIQDIVDSLDSIVMPKANIINMVYPVGSIYMSVASTDPSTFLTGTTWTRLKDRFLLGAGDTYSAGDTGGAASQSYTPAGTNAGTAISVQQMPSHNHTFTGTSATTSSAGGSHTHSVGAHSHGLNSHVHSLNNHTHAGPSHTHSLGNHTHTGPSHTHTFTVQSANNGGIKGSANQKTGFWNATVGSGSSTWAVLSLGQNYEGVVAGLVVTGTTDAGGTGATGAASGNTGAAGTGATGVPSESNTGAATGSTANSTAFNTGSTSIAHTHTVTATGSIGNAGSGQTHTHTFTGTAATIATMPPYLAVYMWKRTA